MMAQRKQLNSAKVQAILDTAEQVFPELGLAAPLDLIAKRARVSKQTIYNQYGGRTGLIRALARRWLELPTDSLSVDPAEATLAAFAEKVINIQLRSSNVEIIPLYIRRSSKVPHISQAMMNSGFFVEPLTKFLEKENICGRLSVDDAVEAAAFFIGMTIGIQLDALLVNETPSDCAAIKRLSANIAYRFVRAYAPSNRSNPPPTHRSKSKASSR